MFKENHLQIAQTILESLVYEFNLKTSVLIVAGEKNVPTIETTIEDNVALARFKRNDEVYSISFPIPFVEDGVVLVEANETKRAICSYLVKAEDREYSFLSMVYRILCGTPVGIVEKSLIKKISFIQRVIYGFKNNNVHVMVASAQKAIDSVVYDLPLHETTVNSLVINHRVKIIDRNFDEITDPNKRLTYQVEKAKEYFARGWTPVGLSDSSMADNNYMIKSDLRLLSPFGLKHHNPQRNLFSSINTKGDERPIVKTRTEDNLEKNGIVRHGWNLFTCFADIPDVWEDQLIVNKDLANLSVKYSRKFVVYDRLNVKKGEKIKEGHVLAFNKKGERQIFDVVCDKAVVKGITSKRTILGSVEVDSFIVSVEFERYFKDGFKLTNRSANKGVIRMMETGYAIDPRTGEHRKIDIIVSSKAVLKRKNYGQLLEALMNLISGDSEVVIDDDYGASIDEIENALKNRNLPTDGTMVCNTYAGEFKAICGKVFWGVIKTPEDFLWEDDVFDKKDNKDLRIAGMKFSSIEFRGIATQFGDNNPLIDEIMSYAQGTTDLHEMLKIIKSKRGELPNNKVVLNYKNIKPLDQSKGLFIDEVDTVDTIVEAGLHSEGFILELPVIYQVIVGEKGDIISEGQERYIVQEEAANYKKVINFNKIYVPATTLRKCWRHASGKLGLSTIGALLNNIIDISHRYDYNREDVKTLSLLHSVIRNYFNTVAEDLGSKRGMISTYGMSVRYPFSAKGVATLSTTLPENTIEMHRETAKPLCVSDGDVVLVERYPCLGFVSIRAQKIRLTDDPMCRYTIRVSGNSLGSIGLDFDGDNVYVASFRTPGAKLALIREWTNPNPICYAEIVKLNNQMGQPQYKAMSLRDYDIKMFEPLTNEAHADIVASLVGVKAQTGPVIALSYNLMRIVEMSSSMLYNGNKGDMDKINVGVEVFLNAVANSIFKQKHGVKSLQNIVVDAVCMGDVPTLVQNGFEENTSLLICNIIRHYAKELGVTDLRKYHVWAKEKGRSNIINRIVRKKNKIYFASRSSLEGLQLLEHLEAEAVDIPSRVLKWVLSGEAERVRNSLDDVINSKMLDTINDSRMKEACEELVNVIDMCFYKQEEDVSKGYMCKVG